MPTLWQLVSAHIPADHSSQVHSRYYIKTVMSRPDAPTLVVDLGCGDGSSAPIFRQHKKDVCWVGVDIAESEKARQLGGENVLFYDGVHLPFPDGALPLIYSNQVFEHVRHPEPLLRDIARVLTPGGLFIGSTSQLEPYHASSLWNYTVYGFKVLVEDAGLRLEEVRPGIDGLALINRQLLGSKPEHGAWFAQSPLNTEIDEWGRDTGRVAKQVNARKLQFCGQFSFQVRKPQRAVSDGGERSTGWSPSPLRLLAGRALLGTAARLLRPPAR